MRALRTARGGTARKDNAPSRPAESSLNSKLAKLGIRTDFDLVLHLPLRYEDETVLTPIDAARHGAPRSSRARSSRATSPSGRAGSSSQVRDASGVLFARFLNFYPSQARALAPGVRVRLFGEVRPGFFGDEMVHPRYRVPRGPEPPAAAMSLTPVYPTTAGLGQVLLRKLIDEALGRADLADLPLPATLPARRPLPLSPLRSASPSPPPGRPPRAPRPPPPPGAAEEVLTSCSRSSSRCGMHYRARRAQAAPPLASRGDLVARLLARLPFKLTRAQVRAWGEIERDLAAAHPMNRLLQGDVGSGKTVVAAARGGACVESGWQVAVMAPTEILAEQTTANSPSGSRRSA